MAKYSLPTEINVPFIDINHTALDSWKQHRLADTEASLTETITSSQHPSHHALASRALSVKIQPSVIGYIAKSVALICGGKPQEGCWVFDFVFRHCDPIDMSLLLLIKAVVLFMAGEHDDAISCVGNLIATVHLNSIFRVVQAYMYFLLGNLHMESGDCYAAEQSFEHARSQTQYYYMGPPLSSISLVSFLLTISRQSGERSSPLTDIWLEV
ncbi:hypothetical protein J3R83DRAFT_7273 [Lanmaoa asiatica]|nr:hypothetical protein J3R83DRAFT_7273 [Lanmaoa asiatica]